jgi:release factor glutamine methyltransferase
MKAIDRIREISDFLKGYGIDNATKEAETILQRCSDIDIVEVYRDNPQIPQSCSESAERLAGRRALREPLAYIIGEVSFLDLILSVGHGVLIPRPETELMAAHAIETMGNSKREQRDMRFLDLCTGSGCLALALAYAFQDSHVYAGDISPGAIRYARENALRNGIVNIEFLAGDLFGPLRARKEAERFDLIISNPPYIKSADVKGLQPEIRSWEPRNAIDGGDDGLRYYRRLIPEAPQFLIEGGLLILEIGAGSLVQIREMLEKAGFSRIRHVRDYGGYERVVQATWKS